MATYNGEKYIREQLSTILPTLSEVDELIISDDGSTDMTLKIIKSYEDQRIIVLDDKEFKSPVSISVENSPPVSNFATGCAIMFRSRLLDVFQLIVKFMIGG